MDLYNNEIVAYRVGHSQEAELVLETWKEACNGRETKGLILHSDQGAQYTSYAFQELAEEKGITTSMSRKGNCFDNAVIESFHSNHKVGRILHTSKDASYKFYCTRKSRILHISN